MLRRDAGIITSGRRNCYVATEENGHRERTGTGDRIAWNWGSEGTAGESMGEDSKKSKRSKVTFDKSEKVKVKR